MGKQCCNIFSAIVDQILFIFASRFCLFCAFTRPKYQVSVYRTIGPLVPFSGENWTRFLKTFYANYNRTQVSFFVGCTEMINRKCAYFSIKTQVVCTNY